MIASLAIMAFIVLLMWFEKDNYKAWMMELELQKMIDQGEQSGDSTAYCMRCGIPHKGKCKRQSGKRR